MSRGRHFGHRGHRSHRGLAVLLATILAGLAIAGIAASSASAEYRPYFAWTASTFAGTLGGIDAVGTRSDVDVYTAVRWEGQGSTYRWDRSELTGDVRPSPS